MSLDITLLARLQFAFTIMFHYLFPPLTIGLGLVLVVTEGLYLKTKNPIYESITKFWAKIFAVNFALGVATGIVMEFQFGTNWAGYSRFVGDVFGAALAAEGIFAFFLESGFLAVLLFGWDRVSPKIHFISTIMVASGATFSAFWIIVANSWQQFPVGYHLVKHGPFMRAEVSDFWQVIFNPGAIPRFYHAVLGGWIQAAFVVMSISAFYLLKNKHLDFAKRSFIVGLVIAAGATTLQAVTGDALAVLVSEKQPAKLAAFEGLITTRKPAPLTLFGIPDEKNQTMHAKIELPMALSLLARHDPNAEIKGLDAFPKRDRPPLTIPFLSFHGMVGVGFALLSLSWFGVWQWRRGKLFEQRWLLWTFVAAVIGPYIANELGWAATEVGRQPWLVYGLLRTSEGVSRAVDAPQVLSSLIMFALLYAVLFLVYVYTIDRKIKHGPEPVHVHSDQDPPHGAESWMAISADRLDRSEHTLDDN